ncbi:16860_t:CDS:2 [Funneliformis geosporum]|uniref:16229_t:CDS:1 n=1 Tax=Funneliformis geosporum TaxID=1117311 RepID=A0A9W4SH26_9GLOM|nr:16229_t:CDS:2 [Funneliformis geosporum]CAI2169682.1 16860_t:CDS:2 [Funneliformis geosporum]
MVVRIRLARHGVRNRPFYHIVVANARAPRDGKHIAKVGLYDPIPNQQGIKKIELEADKIKYWLSVGAQPSDTVARLLSKSGFDFTTLKDENKSKNKPNTESELVEKLESK